MITARDVNGVRHRVRQVLTDVAYITSCDGKIRMCDRLLGRNGPLEKSDEPITCLKCLSGRCDDD